MNTVVTKKTMPRDLGMRMKSFRLERDWTIKRAAKEAKISTNAWGYIENGKIPTERIASRICRNIPEIFARRAA